MAKFWLSAFDMLTSSIKEIFLITSYNNPARWPQIHRWELRPREVKYLCMSMMSPNTYFCIFLFPLISESKCETVTLSTLDNSRRVYLQKNCYGVGEWRRMMEDGTDIQNEEHQSATIPRPHG